jgi:5-methyltetrahydropteroyltriglutamate--homocysteine methyltransferase
MPLPLGVYRADHVGSLLRPREILAYREDIADGNGTLDHLRKLEDDYVAKIVKDEIDAGLRSITDGEFRRAYFHLDFLQHFDGVEVRGGLVSSNTGREGMIPPKLVVTGKLGHPKSIQVDDFNYLEAQIEKAGAKGKVTTKVCIPSPTMVHFRGGRDTIDSTAYPDLDPFFDDLARVYQEELDDLYKAGCRFVQLDDTNLAYLCDEKMRKEAGERHGGDPGELAAKYATLINKAISKRPRDLTIGIHLCRGNYRSTWFAQGGYEPVAEVLFKQLDVDVYFLEYDDARSGDFKPLRHLPENKIVVLGVLSSKVPELDVKEQIVSRVMEAANFCPRGLDQLCLSHQCGFSSTMEGNDLSVEQQWAKIKLEVEIAKQIWDEDLSM